MKAFNEKCDAVLHCLKNQDRVSWGRFTQETKIPKFDALLSYLKETKDYIDYNDNYINITEKGKLFITGTSFVEQRNSIY